MKFKIAFAKPEERAERFERIRNAGMTRFLLTRGGLFAAVFGLSVCVISRPNTPWYRFVTTVLLVSMAWGTAMWYVTMWQYRRSQKQGYAR